jgi:hypothetical protein
MGQDSLVRGAEHVLHHIRKRQVRTFETQEVWQWTKNFFDKKMDKLKPVLALLIEYQYLRPIPVPPKATGRPHAPSYEVNPAVFALSTKSTKSTKTGTASLNGHAATLRGFYASKDMAAFALYCRDHGLSFSAALDEVERGGVGDG